MDLGEPYVRDDAVDYYADLLRRYVIDPDSLSLAAVRGLPVDEALVRFGGFPAGSWRLTAEEIAAMNRCGAQSLPLVLADVADGSVFLADNGVEATRTVGRLSAGTVAAGLFWNVEWDNTFIVAVDGVVVVSLDLMYPDVRTGTDPTRMDPFMDGLTFEDARTAKAQALTLVERICHARVAPDWQIRPHPVSVLVSYDRFDRGRPDWRSQAGGSPPSWFHGPVTVLIESASLVAARACAETGADADPVVRAALAADPGTLADEERARMRAALLDRARDAVRRGLQARWDALDEPDDEPVGGGIEDLVADLAAAPAPPPGQDELRTAAAIAAARARLDPAASTALAATLGHASKAVPAAFPALYRDAADLLDRAGPDVEWQRSFVPPGVVPPPGGPVVQIRPIAPADGGVSSPQQPGDLNPPPDASTAP